MQNSWAEHLIHYYEALRPPAQLPPGISWLYPQKDEVTKSVVRMFLRKFFDDTNKRKLFLGINPGRFGAGVTGVNFTGPRQLTQYCGIEHPFGNGSELSAEFIYDMISAYGGAGRFYGSFFIGSVCPLGFVRNGKNLNYYDDRQLQTMVEPFIISSMNALLRGPVDRSVCYCIGGEKNYNYLSRINEEQDWFARIVPLPHPRFIMQYRRRQKDQYVQEYLDRMTEQ